MIPELTTPIKIEIPGIGTIESADLYLNVEADKVIEFWKKESHDHYERWFSLNKQYEGWFGKVMRCERAERETRHHKYKRCIGMSKLCQWKMCVFIYHKEKNDFYYRWHKRWLELAKNFKEA